MDCVGSRCKPLGGGDFRQSFAAAVMQVDELLGVGDVAHDVEFADGFFFREVKGRAGFGKSFAGGGAGVPLAVAREIFRFVRVFDQNVHRLSVSQVLAGYQHTIANYLFARRHLITHAFRFTQRFGLPAAHPAASPSPGTRRRASASWTAAALRRFGRGGIPPAHPRGHMNRPLVRGIGGMIVILR